MSVRDYNATYSYKPLTLTLKLTDGPSGSSGVLTFHGFLNGILYALPTITYSDNYQSILIGQDIYRVNMVNAGINAFESYPYPAIFAEIDASPASTTPEPSSLLLTVMALPWLGLVRWRRPAR